MEEQNGQRMQQVMLLGKHIAMLQRMIGTGLNQRFQSKGYDITLPHWIILHILWEKEGVSQNLLAEELNVNRAAITHLVDMMEKRNLVVRIPQQHDRRVNLIYLTHAGKMLREELIGVALEFMQEHTSGLSDTELNNFYKVLFKLQQAFLDK